MQSQVAVRRSQPEQIAVRRNLAERLQYSETATFPDSLFQAQSQFAVRRKTTELLQ